MKRFHFSRAEQILCNARTEMKRRKALEEHASDENSTELKLPNSICTKRRLIFDQNRTSLARLPLNDAKVLNWLSTVDESDTFSTESTDWNNGQKQQKAGPAQTQQEAGIEKLRHLQQQAETQKRHEAGIEKLRHLQAQAETEKRQEAGIEKLRHLQAQADTEKRQEAGIEKLLHLQAHAEKEKRQEAGIEKLVHLQAQAETEKRQETGIEKQQHLYQQTEIETFNPIQKSRIMITSTESPEGSFAVRNDCDIEFSEDDDHDVDFVPDSDTESCIIPVYSALSSPLLLFSKNKDPINSSNSLINKSVRKKTHQRIPRPCMFCSSFQTNLHRHIAVKHHSEDIVLQTSTLSKRECLAAFARMRKEGISKHNRAQIKAEFPIYESERSSTHYKSLVQCGNCLGFYSKEYFARHRKLCIADLAEEPKAMPLEFLADSFCNLKEKFKTEILACFSKDSVGQLCKTDEMLRLFGSRMFEKLTGKTDKKAEVRKSVMSDMRRLAYLFQTFKKICENAGVQVVSSYDMLSRKNFSYLEEAITEYTGTSLSADGLKAGLKTALNYLIKRFLKVVKASYLVRDEDEKASEIDKFLEVFQLNQHHIFGDATYKLNRNRQENLRRPAELPSEADIEKIKQYTVQRVAMLLQDEFLIWDMHTFTELRDLTVSRLTLFNARRGGEPARLRISEWLDAENNSWLDFTRAQHLENDVDRSLFHNMKVTFQGGKGNNHLVPVLFPLDIIPAMQKLLVVRESAGIRKGNCYMFPCTQYSDTHVSGWHAVSRISKDANLENPERLTATKMRHRVSTLYAAMDVSEGERQLFYKHMGHSASINANVYQAPLAEAEILKVGKRLQQMDGHVLMSDEPRNSMVDISVISLVPTQDREKSVKKGNKQTDVESTLLAPEKRVTGIVSSLAHDGPVQAMDGGKSVAQSQLLSRDNKVEPPATTNSKKHGKKNFKGRDYTRWSERENMLIRQAFGTYITDGGFPCHGEILQFQEAHPEIHHSYQKIYTKIFNEQKTSKHRSERRLQSFQPSN